MILLTSGEPAGIGPDIILKLGTHQLLMPWVVLADRGLLEDRARQLNLSLTFADYQPGQRLTAVPAGVIYVWHLPLIAHCQAGVLNPDNARYVIQMIALATEACLAGNFDAMVTAPVHKGVINQAGIIFSGHTELLAQLTHTPQVVMMLTTDAMRVALVTTHLPLRQVADAVTQTKLVTLMDILNQALQQYFGLAQPEIHVAGLNPHAGEGGYLGTEEIDIIQPALQQCQAAGIDVKGPFPADTLFTPPHLADADVFVAMYHDQGLAVLKYAGFGAAVNITLGLPIIRTSVDHGTALALAGSGNANEHSLIMAINTAHHMRTCHHAHQYNRRTI